MDSGYVSKTGAKPVKIAVVGAGLMGMAVARKLALSGASVTVLEANKQIGGLATWHDYGGFAWDRFYHVILPTDRHLIAFIKEIGLAGNLEWRRTYTGFYVGQKFYSISSNLEFLKFPLLSFLSKARLAWTMLYCSRISNWQKLEQQKVEDFLIRVSGREAYERLWKPLLLAKLGENYRRVSAVFIWSYVKRMFSARDRSASSEMLGHVTGGYKMVFEKLEQDIVNAGGQIALDTKVKSIKPRADTGLDLETELGYETYDQVVFTSPVSALRQIAHPDLVRVALGNNDVEYLGVVCAVLVSRKPLVPFYVVNIADETIPFTGMIGMSTVVDPKYTGNRYLTYLPKYVLSTDSYMDRSDSELEKEFLEGARKMLPAFDDLKIERVIISRARKVQPLQVLNYSSLVPEVNTQHPGFFVLNTSQFVNSTLNNNEVISASNKFLEGHIERHFQKLGNLEA